MVFQDVEETDVLMRESTQCPVQEPGDVHEVDRASEESTLVAGMVASISFLAIYPNPDMMADNNFQFRASTGKLLEDVLFSLVYGTSIMEKCDRIWDNHFTECWSFEFSTRHGPVHF